MEIEMELQQRIEEEGFEILLILPVMEAVSIGLQRFNWALSRRSLHNLIFDYLPGKPSVWRKLFYQCVSDCVADNRWRERHLVKTEEQTNGVKWNIFRVTSLYIIPLSQSSFHFTLELIFYLYDYLFFYNFEPNQSLPPGSEVQLIAAACILWRCSWQSVWEAVSAAFW